MVIHVPASKGYEDRPIVVIQGHMDMVCEKNKATEHDFASDPLKLRREGDTLFAEGTTLGADNGIAVAMGLALLDSDTPHGPLELLFTTDEESGLTGALNLDPSLINGKILLNLDSEEEGVFYIGCAGGVTTIGDIPVEWSAPEEQATAVSVSITGLKGGHSGADIHEGRGNAVKLGSRLLWNLHEEFPIRISQMEGGGKHNVIPREFFVTCTVPGNQKKQLIERVQEAERTFAAEFGDIEPNMKVEVKEENTPAEKVLSPRTTSRTIGALYLIPHGVDEMSRTIEGLVETSTNLASVTLRDSDVHVTTSQRSSMISKRDDICARVTAAMRTAGAKVQYRAVYPAWTPNPDNPLIDIFSSAYRELSGQEPTVTAIHAGLESGVIGDKFSGMHMISMGPDLREVHTPDEHISISSVGRIWQLLTKVLPELKI
jgi:dipeptidase D